MLAGRQGSGWAVKCRSLLVFRPATVEANWAGRSLLLAKGTRKFEGVLLGAFSQLVETDALSLYRSPLGRVGGKKYLPW